MPRSSLSRTLVQYELYKRVLGLKGNIVELGVYRGESFLTWVDLCETLEPQNRQRRLYGFDVFDALPRPQQADGNAAWKEGLFEASYEWVIRQLQQRFKDTYTLQRTTLVRGRIEETVPQWLDECQSELIALLFIDTDLFAPADTALRSLLPRVVPGGIVAFDEVNNRDWPGETRAYLGAMHDGRLPNPLEAVHWESNICWTVKP